MTTRAFRFQADIDPATGLFTVGSMYDQQVVEDLITGEQVGAFSFSDPTLLPATVYPALFAALNEISSKSSERIQEKRAAFLAAKSAEPAKLMPTELGPVGLKP